MIQYIVFSGGVQDSEFRFSGFSGFSDLEFLRGALIVPDAATVESSSPRLCGQSLSGIDAAVLLVAIVLEYTFRVWSVFRQVARAVGGVTRGACCA